LRGVFVTGTDTEVGKSVVAASICAALTAAGERVAAFKPVVTGMDEEPGEFGRDHELLASVAGAGQSPEDVAPHRFGPAVSPHLAAQLAGTTLEPAELVSAAREHELVVCEGVGGLLVPITPGYLVRDLAMDLALPLVVASRPGLGTISHTLLTLEAARAGGLTVVAVVMTPWPDEPTAMQRSNRETIERLGDVAVAGLPHTTPAGLAEAGASLPLADWL
jgi:dethiobiotin synthetase